MRDIAQETTSTNRQKPPQSFPTMADYVRESKRLDCPKGGRCVLGHRSDATDGLLTVITAVLNCAKTLPKTFDSIRSQTYRNIQYIVVDGGSQDGTLEFLEKHEMDLDIWLSEPDQGISDAFNKGIALATGEYVALVNADDWLEPDHFRLAIEHLKRSDADFTFGNLMFHDHEGAPLYTLIGDALYASKILHAMPAINHPSIVCRRSLYERNGLFDKTFRIAMDYEWLLRNHKQGARGAYIPDITSHMGTNGISQRRVLASLKEVERASIRYGYSASRARIRYWIRTTKVTLRLFIERNVSLSLAISLRALINSRYQRR
jgi:glycosyltransferase involved in cell wall biosynthesis